MDVLVPAIGLKASYDSSKQALRLRAQGEARPITTNIYFEELGVINGALVYALRGYYHAVADMPRMPYVREQSFYHALPNPGIPRHSVKIITENYPTGKWVPIDGLPQQDEIKVQQLALAASNEVPKLPTVVPPTQMFVRLGEPFYIREQVPQHMNPRLRIKYNSNFFRQTEAYLQDGAMTWVFDPMRIGLTQATVYSGYKDPLGQPTFDTEIHYIIMVLPTRQITMESDIELPVITFRSIVNIGIGIIREKYPDAALLTVKALTFSGEASSNPWDFTKIKITTHISVDDLQRSATIESVGDDGFGPVVVGDLQIGASQVPWPDKKIIDLQQADKLLKDGGEEDQGPYNSVVFIKPSQPFYARPVYRFWMEKGDRRVEIDAEGLAAGPDKETNGVVKEAEPEKVA